MDVFYCPVSGCTPEIMHSLELAFALDRSLSPNFLRAVRELSAAHKSSSQGDLSVIGTMHPSAQPFAVGLEDGLAPDSEDEIEDDAEEPGPPPSEVCPETDIRVMPSCGDFHCGFVYGPQSTTGKWAHFVAYGSSFAVQTYALDIMAVATNGRMTPLRLWRLAMKQGFYEKDHPVGFEGVHYGDIEQFRQDCESPKIFPGFEKKDWDEVKKLSDVEVIKQRFVHEGKFWMWMSPDQFPISSADHDPPAPILPEAQICKSRLSALEKLPLDVLVSIVSNLPLESLVTLASTSRFLRSGIFGNEHLARAWMSTSSPWWIPVPTRTGDTIAKRGATITVPYPASQSSLGGQNIQGHLQVSTAGLDWAYVRRCARSGSMRNRRRIWNTVLDIERVADLDGV